MQEGDGSATIEITADATGLAEEISARIKQGIAEGVSNAQRDAGGGGASSSDNAGGGGGGGRGRGRGAGSGAGGDDREFKIKLDKDIAKNIQSALDSETFTIKLDTDDIVAQIQRAFNDHVFKVNIDGSGSFEVGGGAGGGAGGHGGIKFTPTNNIPDAARVTDSSSRRSTGSLAALMDDVPVDMLRAIREKADKNKKTKENLLATAIGGLYESLNTALTGSGKSALSGIPTDRDAVKTAARQAMQIYDFFGDSFKEIASIMNVGRDSSGSDDVARMRKAAPILAERFGIDNPIFAQSLVAQIGGVARADRASRIFGVHPDREPYAIPNLFAATVSGRESAPSEHIVTPTPTPEPSAATKPTAEPVKTAAIPEAPRTESAEEELVRKTAEASSRETRKTPIASTPGMGPAELLADLPQFTTTPSEDLTARLDKTLDNIKTLSGKKKPTEKQLVQLAGLREREQELRAAGAVSTAELERNRSRRGARVEKSDTWKTVRPRDTPLGSSVLSEGGRSPDEDITAREAGVERLIPWGDLDIQVPGVGRVDLRGIANLISRGGLRDYFKSRKAGGKVYRLDPRTVEELDYARSVANPQTRYVEGIDESVRYLPPMKVVEQLIHAMFPGKGQQVYETVFGTPGGKRTPAGAAMAAAIKQGGALKPMGSGDAHVAAGAPDSIRAGIQDIEAQVAGNTRLGRIAKRINELESKAEGGEELSADERNRLGRLYTIKDRLIMRGATGRGVGAQIARDKSAESRRAVEAGVGLNQDEFLKNLRSRALPRILKEKTEDGKLPDWMQAIVRVRGEIERGGEFDRLVGSPLYNSTTGEISGRHPSNESYAHARIEQILKLLREGSDADSDEIGRILGLRPGELTEEGARQFRTPYIPKGTSRGDQTQITSLFKAVKGDLVAGLDPRDMAGRPFSERDEAKLDQRVARELGGYRVPLAETGDIDQSASQQVRTARRAPAAQQSHLDIEAGQIAAKLRGGRRLYIEGAGSKRGEPASTNPLGTSFVDNTLVHPFASNDQTGDISRVKDELAALELERNRIATELKKVKNQAIMEGTSGVGADNPSIIPNPKYDRQTRELENSLAAAESAVFAKKGELPDLGYSETRSDEQNDLRYLTYLNDIVKARMKEAREASAKKLGGMSRPEFAMRGLNPTDPNDPTYEIAQAIQERMNQGEFRHITAEREQPMKTTGDDYRRAHGYSAVVGGGVPEEATEERDFSEVNAALGGAAGGGGGGRGRDTSTSAGDEGAGAGRGGGSAEVSGDGVMHVIVDSGHMNVTVDNASDMRGNGRVASDAGDASANRDAFGSGGGSRGGARFSLAAMNRRRRALGLEPIFSSSTMDEDDETTDAVGQRSEIMTQVQQARRFEPHRSFGASLTDVLTNMFPFIGNQMQAINRFAIEGQILGSLQARQGKAQERVDAATANRDSIQQQRAEAAAKYQAAKASGVTGASLDSLKKNFQKLSAELRIARKEVVTTTDDLAEAKGRVIEQEPKTAAAKAGLPGTGGKLAALGAAGLASGIAGVVASGVSEIAKLVVATAAEIAGPQIERAMGSPTMSNKLALSVGQAGNGGLYEAALASQLAQIGMSTSLMPEFAKRAATLQGNVNLEAQNDMLRSEFNTERTGANQGLKNSQGGILGTGIGWTGMEGFTLSTQELLQQRLDRLPDFNGRLPNFASRVLNTGSQPQNPFADLVQQNGGQPNNPFADLVQQNGGQPQNPLADLVQQNGGQPQNPQDYNQQFAEGKKELDSFNSAVHKASKELHGVNLALSDSPQEVAAFAKSLRDNGYDKMANKVEQSGLTITGGPADYKTFEKMLTAWNVSAQQLDLGAAMTAMGPQIKAQDFLRRKSLDLELNQTIPSQLGFSQAANPLATGAQVKAIAAAMGGTTDVSGTADLYEQIAKDAKSARDSMKDIVSEQMPDYSSQFNTTLDDIVKKGREIADIRIGREIAHASLEADKYSWSLTLANRSLADAKYLAGDLTKANENNLGYLQRQSWELGRQSQLLSLQLQQRQINFNVAVAGFAAPGQTPEERAARIEAAKVEADYAQKQLDIQKKLYGLSGQEFLVSARRSVTDLSRQINFMMRERQLVIDDYNANQKIAGMQTQLDQMTKKADAIYNTAVKRQADIYSAEAELVAKTGADLTDIKDQVLSAFQDSYNSFIDTINANPPTIINENGGVGNTPYGPYTSPTYAPSTGEVYGPQVGPLTWNKDWIGSGYNYDNSTDKDGNPTTYAATGLLGTTTGRTDITVGEAGAETVAILRNPRAYLTPANGGGGNCTFIFPNLVIREREDIDRLASAFEQKINRRASLMGLRPGS